MLRGGDSEEEQMKILYSSSFDWGIGDLSCFEPTQSVTINDLGALSIALILF